MPRTVRDARLETRAARERLPAQREPHWRALGQGEHLGYYKGATGGTWIARWRPAGGGAYRKKRLGLADDVRDADGASVLGFSQAQAAARNWLADMSRAAVGMEPMPSGPYRVRDATDDYLKWFQKHRKSAADTRNKIDYYILPDLGDIAVSELTTARLRAWHETIATSNRGRRKSKKPQSATKVSKATLGGAAPVGEPSGDAAEGAQADPTSTKPNAPPEERTRARRATANRALTVLKALLTFAFGENKVASDLAWRRVKPFGGADSARVRYLSADEAQRLINACDPDFRRLVRAGLETGCRYGELRNLLVEDFHQDAPSLLIRDSKGGKPRHVPLDQQAAQFFTTVCAGRPGGEPMLRREDSAAWGPSQQQRRLFDASKKAKITPAANFHMLRHTWASQRIMAGMPLMVAAQVLGHSDTRMVERHYGHLARSFIQRAVESTTIKFAPEPTTVQAIRQG